MTKWERHNLESLERLLALNKEIVLRVSGDLQARQCQLDHRRQKALEAETLAEIRYYEKMADKTQRIIKDLEKKLDTFIDVVEELDKEIKQRRREL